MFYRINPWFHPGKFNKNVLRPERTFTEVCAVLKQACQWDLRNRARAGRHAGKSVCQRDWSCRQHNKFHWKSRRQVFSSRLKRNLFFNFCVCHKKGESWMEQSILLLLCILLLLLHSITICKIRVIYCKVLKVFNFKLVSSFLSFKILFWAKTSSDTRLIR